jgi:hypothetical protein
MQKNNKILVDETKKKKLKIKRKKKQTLMNFVSLS